MAASEISLSRPDTGELLRIIEESRDLPATMTEYAGDFVAIPFPEYLAELMEERALNAAALAERALLSRSFTYQLLSGERAPGRDIVLRLAVVLQLTTEETQRLLRSAQRGALYPRVPRDAAIIYALNRNMGMQDTDELLSSMGEPALI